MRTQRGDGERILAVFIDFENLALGFGGRRDRFRIEKVLERIVEKGKIVAKKAYADWSRFGGYAGELHQSAVELVEIPKRTQTGKNSADIRMCVDAMDLAYSKEHIDTFVIVSGDSDFSPLVSKLKELGKHVIGLGLTESTSNLLRDNCDEFIYYEDLDRAPLPALPEADDLPEAKRKVFTLLLDSLLALRRENKEVIGASMVKDTMKRKKPSFNEEYHGYRTFSELLEDAQRHGLLDLDKAKNSGSYVVTRFGSEPGRGAAPVRPVALPPRQPAALPPAGGSRGREAPPAAEPRGPRPPRRDRDEAPPPPRRPAEPPVRPAATVPADTGDETGDDRVLGRALIEDVIEDPGTDDEVPSYKPRKKAPAAEKPVASKPAVPKPAPPSAEEPRRGAASGRGRKPAEKPAEKVVGKTAEKPAPAKPAASRSSAGEGRGRRPAAEAKSERTAKSPPPPPQADEDDAFGAGL